MNIAQQIVLDRARAQRTGFDEAILCSQKTPQQIAQICDMSADAGERRLFTRLTEDNFSKLSSNIQNMLNYDPVAKTAVLGEMPTMESKVRIAIVSAGSSDAPIVAEAANTLRYSGENSKVFTDVGVAGIWRLLDRVEEIATFPVLIAVAGMDAALPTVLGGLVSSVIIGVPTSTGYGAARSGETALASMLTSCSSGLSVTNIDNGYGAAISALRMVNMLDHHLGLASAKADINSQSRV